MNKSTLSALVVALMLGSGIAGYLIGKPTDSVDRAPPPARTATAPTPPPPVAAPQAPAAQRPAATPAALPAPTSAPTAPTEAFGYRRLSLDNSAAEADACLFFNKPLVAGDTVKYADYVSISPEVKSALRVVDDKLCIGGLTYGHDYSVTLLSGLPSADGSKLADERKVEVALGPRPPVITLPGKGFILPRGTAAGLPITTVNISKLALSVYRVNERGLDKFVERYYYGAFPGSEPSTEMYALRQWLNGDNGKRIWRGTMDPRDRPGLEARRLLRDRLERGRRVGQGQRQRR
jgi:alpha-2-macroglobulin